MLNTSDYFGHLRGYPLAILIEKDPTPHLCSLCNLILRQPEQIEDCGHRYCHGCLLSITSRSQPLCPACQAEGEETMVSSHKIFPDKAKSKEMAHLNVYCEYKEQGCDQQLKFSNLQSHVEECPYAVVSCNLCQKPVQKKDLQKHKSTLCEEREISCETCKKMIKFKDKQSHDDKECVGKLEQCKYCGALFKDMEAMKKHIEEDCVSSWTLNKGCPYGCKGPFKTEKELFEHREKFAQLHLDNLYARQGELSREIESKYGKKTGSGDMYGSGARNDETPQDVQALLTSYDEQIIPAIVDEIQQLIEDKAGMDEEFHSLSQEMQTLITTSYDGILIWPIGKINEHINNAKAAKVTEIYSPPFHTGRYGYKLCLRLFPNGDPKESTSWDQNVAIYLQVMDGHFDALLPFPFNESFEISMISDKKQTVKKVSFQNPGNFSLSTQSRAFGSSTFVPIGELKTIENVFIKCVVDFKIVTP